MRMHTTFTLLIFLYPTHFVYFSFQRRLAVRLLALLQGGNSAFERLAAIVGSSSTWMAGFSDTLSACVHAATIV